MPDSQATYELDLARKLIGVSNLLAAQLYPKITFIPDHDWSGYVNTWYVKDPDFSRIEVSVRGLDISGPLNDLAQKTNELLIHMRLLPEEVDEEFGYVPPQYVWEVEPPKISKESEGPSSSLGLNGILFTMGLEGLSFTQQIPVRIPDNSSETLRKLREYGIPDLDLLQWHDFGEITPYKGFHTKKENVMLAMIERNPTERLRIAYWLLDGLTRAKEVRLQESYKVQ
ncbi:MAG: hypothetical protein IIC69_01845 [Nanoarchaeota archaeon]|nr:hypothetical protein [Nanoarchaeota archaeon]